MSVLKYLTPDQECIKIGFKCLCPKCKSASLYKEKEFMTLQSVCPNCGLDFSKVDSADAPAVFLIFILGFLVVPSALLLEVYMMPPLWVHAVLWTLILLILTVGTLRPLKAYTIALQYKHLPWD